MKVTVIEMYQDKVTKEYHNVGDILDIKDSKRVDALVDRRLIEVAEPIKTPKKTKKEPIED